MSIGDAIERMEDRDFSQCPVINERRRIVGFVTLHGLEGKLKRHEATVQYSKIYIYLI